MVISITGICKLRRFDKSDKSSLQQSQHKSMNTLKKTSRKTLIMLSTSKSCNIFSRLGRQKYNPLNWRLAVSYFKSCILHLASVAFLRRRQPFSNSLCRIYSLNKPTRIMTPPPHFGPRKKNFFNAGMLRQVPLRNLPPCNLGGHAYSTMQAQRHVNKAKNKG